MPSSPTHPHALHVVIPTTTDSRVPSTTTPTTPAKNHGPAFRRLNEQARSSPTHGHNFHVLDDSSPTHSHTLLRALGVADSSPTRLHPLVQALDDSSPTHEHGLFVVPGSRQTDHGRSSPTHPHPLTHDGSSSPSLTAPRMSARDMRRSSLFMNSNDYEEEEEAPEHPEASCATAEASELSSAEVDGSFERGVRTGVEGAESVTEA